MNRGVLALFALSLAAVAAPQVKTGSKSISNTVKSKYTITARYPSFTGGPLARAAGAAAARDAQAATKAFLADYRKTGNIGAGGEWYYDSTFKVGVATPNLINWAWTIGTYMGGAHGMTNFDTMTFAMIGGKPKALKLKDLLLPGKQAAVNGLVIQNLKNRDGADFVKDGETKSIPNESMECFLIGTNGITFLIEPYIAGPYASGPFEVTVTWSQLKGLVNPAGPLKPWAR
ncbi:MAG TPA: RsiV family protein [Fimbriimonadaceae bacterium]|nr:RsiV family protein [Fimbriimonadaceae bacterium]